MDILNQSETEAKEVINEEITNALQDLTVEELSIIIEAIYIINQKIEFSSNEELFEMAVARYKNKEVA